MLGSDADEERWPDEPEEFDPETLGPDVPSPPGPGEASNAEAIELFVKLVVVFNIAVLALALGPMFVIFRGRTEFGLQLFLLGVLAFAYGTFRYYRFRAGGDDGAGGSERNG